MPPSISTPGVVIPTSTDPPLPVPAVVLAIWDPLVTVICGASAITEPASPAPIDEAVICAPFCTVRPLAETVTLPPGPDCAPVVEAAICAPFCIVRLLAETVTLPPGPDCAPVVEAAICVPMPSSISTPGVVIPTSTDPPLPVPAVVLAICAPPWTVNEPASTVTDPPCPDCVANAEARIWAPLASSNGPGVFTITEPPGAEPALVAEI